MLAMIKSEFVEDRDAVLRDLQRRVAAAKRTRRLGEIRYPQDLQAKICEWMRAGELSPFAGSKAIGISAPTLTKWLDRASSFRVVDIVESEDLQEMESPKAGLAEIRLGSRAVIRMPVAAIGSDLLKALAHL